MFRVVQLALVALLLTTSCSAWILPPHIEASVSSDDVLDNNCSSYSYEAWLELLPQPVFIDAMPGSEPEEAEEVEDYEESETIDDPDYDPSDSESTDDLEHDLEDGVQVYRKKRNISSVKAGGDNDESSEESGGSSNESSSEDRKKRDVSSEEDDGDSDEEEGSAEESDEEEEEDSPYAFLKLKASHTTGGLLQPNSLAKVMLKNFQKARMSFIMKIEPFRYIDECTAGVFSSHFFFLKLKGCWLEHKQNAHKICKKNHGHHGRNHHGHHEHGDSHNGDHEHGPNHHGDHEHGRNHHGDHEHDPNHHGDHEHGPNHHGDHEHGRNHHGDHEHGPNHHGDHEHGRNHHGHNHHGHNHHHGRHTRDVDELEAEDDDVTTVSPAGDTVEDDSTFKFPRHGFMEPADGEAASCNNTVEGWLEPESAIFVPYTTPSCGCIVISAYVGYPIANGSLVLTAEGNAEFLQYMDCVQPNPTPEDDDLEYYDYEASNDIFSDDHVDMDGIDANNIIEDDATRPTRGRSGLRSQSRRNRQRSDEDESDEGDSDEESTTAANRRGRGRSSPRWGREYEDDEEVYRGRRSPDEGSMSAEDDAAHSRRNERRLEKQRRRAERREARQQRRQGGAGSPSSAEGEDTAMPTDEEIANIDDPRELRRVMKLRRRHMRRLRDRAENSEHRGSGEAPQEVPAEVEEGGRRRGRKGRRQQHEGQGQNRQLIRDLTEPGARFCCKQGIQHKKASTYPEEDGTLPHVQCDVVPAEIPTWASHKHTIQADQCNEHYTDCCSRFNIDAWKAWKERAATRRGSRQQRRRGGRDE